MPSSPQPKTSRMTLHIGLPSRREKSESWGEHEYALALMRALERLGHRSALFYRDERPALTGEADVALHILGPFLDEPVAGIPNILWMISPPNLGGRARLMRFQARLVASRLLSTHLQKIGVPNTCLQQATDTDRFRPNLSGGKSPDLGVVFVGNRGKRADRELVLAAGRIGVPMAIWGRGWGDAVASESIVANRLDASELPGVYARARVVLNSHMPNMRRLGFMSNRSFDALASGAQVVSDAVTGFHDPSIEGLTQIANEAELKAVLERILREPPESFAQRSARATRVAEQYAFAERATQITTLAASLLAAGKVAAAAFSPRLRHSDPAPHEAAVLTLTDAPDGVAAPHPGTPACPELNALTSDQSIELRLVLCDPTSTPPDLTPEQAMQRAAGAILRIGAVLEHSAHLTGLEVVLPGAHRHEGVIHSLMPDWRRLQTIVERCAQNDLQCANSEEVSQIIGRARRVWEIAPDRENPLGFDAIPLPRRTEMLIRVMENRPFFDNGPPGFEFGRHSRHVGLRPRKSPVRFARPLGVMLHLYHLDEADRFAERLKCLPEGAQIYISTDTDAKAAQIQSIFPDATIRVVINCGRDIFPKLIGLADCHDAHDLVLHLHSKKSFHTPGLATWLDMTLAALLPDEARLNRILSLFQTTPQLGIVAPVVPRPIQRAMHWAGNSDLAEELWWRMDMTDPLPEADALAFPAGSMFWARSEVLTPFQRIGLGSAHFAPECGQIDGTLAHAIERLYGPVAESLGYHMVRVAQDDADSDREARLELSKNADLRRLLDEGFLGRYRQVIGTKPQ